MATDWNHVYDMYDHIVDHGWTSVLDHSRGALGTHRASAGLSRRERGVSNGTRGIVRRPQAANRQLRKLNPSPKFAPGKIQPAPRAFSICYPPSFIPTTTTQTYMTCKIIYVPVFAKCVGAQAVQSQACQAINMQQLTRN